ncbi:MAG: hypothetical protein JWM04_111 [Verrucomicrobiales bacterium]|nr:hypothetical protein [Verrucomicrobiales bacterium]
MNPPKRSGRRAVCLLVLFSVWWVAAATVGFSAETLSSEPQVKAAFLINFAKYADWPSNAFEKANSPIVLGVLGDNKVGEELQKVIAGRVINGREIVLKRANSIDEAGACHILFISNAEQQHTPTLLEQVKGHVLTVGESPDFLEKGGVINLVRKDQKIALEVNLLAADKAQIKISSKLLSVATLVKGKAN